MLTVLHIGRKAGLALLLSSAMLFASASAFASAYRSGDKVRISNLHQIEDDLYISGSSITIDGVVLGDLCAAGSNVITNGEITQALNVFAYDVHHAGVVGGSIRAFAFKVTIDGQVGRSLMGFAYDTHIRRGAVIGRDVNLFGYGARIDGQVGGDVKIEGDQVVIAGEIDGNVGIRAKDITLLPPAVIKGDFTYTCTEELPIDSMTGVTILGKVTHLLPEEISATQVSGEEPPATLTMKSVVFPLAKVLAAFFFGVIVCALFRKHAEVSIQELRGRLPTSFAVGLLLLIVLVLAVIVLVVASLMIVVGLILVSGEAAPVGALILVLSILSIPIAAFASVSGGVMLYAGKIAVALVLGYLLARIFKREPKALGKWQLLVGLVLLALVFMIPYVGLLLYLLISITGAGAIVLAIRSCRPQAESPSSAGGVVTSGT